MEKYEYKLIPFPDIQTGRWGRGADQEVTRPVVDLMNELGASGWVFNRTETVSITKRRFFGGRKQESREMMVFRRPTGVVESEEEALTLRMREPQGVDATFPLRPRRPVVKPGSAADKRPAPFDTGFTNMAPKPA